MAAGKIKWTGGGKVDEDRFLTMQEELITLKKSVGEKDQKLREVTAELARTSEAAKRALVMQHQPDQFGNLMPKAQTVQLLNAKRILDLEKEISRLEQDNRELRSGHDRAVSEHKSLRTKMQEHKARAEAASKTVRQLNVKLGKLERRPPAGRAATPGPYSRTESEGRAYMTEHAALRQEVDDLRGENERLLRTRDEAGEAAVAAQRQAIQGLEAELSAARTHIGKLSAQQHEASRGGSPAPRPPSRTLSAPPARGEAPHPALAEQLGEVHATASQQAAQIVRLQGELAAAREEATRWQAATLQPAEVEAIRSGNPDHERTLARLTSGVEQYTRLYQQAQAKIQAMADQQKEVGGMLERTHGELRDTKDALVKAEAGARQAEALQREVHRLQEDLQRRTAAHDRAQDDLLASTQQQSSELEALKAQVWQLKRSVQEAQGVESALRREKQQLIDQGAPSKEAYRELEVQLREEALRRTAAEAEAEQTRRLLELSSVSTGGALATMREHTSRLHMTSSTGPGGLHHGAAPPMARSAVDGGVSFTPDEVALIQMDETSKEADKYKQLYTTVTAENERLRAENGDLLRGLNSHAEALRDENTRLQARLDRAQQELEKARRLLAAAQAGGGAAAVAEAARAEVPDVARELEGIGENENLFELRIERGALEVGVDVATFVTVDFYDHPTQVSTLQHGPRPAYDSTVQFVVPMSGTFLRYLAATVLRVELNQLVGYTWREVGRAHLPLAHVREDLRLETAGAAPRRRTLHVQGPGGADLGSITITYLMYKPLLPFLQRLADDLAGPAQQESEGNVFARFAAEAQRDVSAASAIRVTVHSCSELQLPSGGASSHTYVQYEFPGHPAAIDTAVQPGASPRFDESRTFEFAPNPQSSPAFGEALRAGILSFAVFDASGVGDGAQVGVCNIPLQELAGDARRITGARFKLVSPVTKAFAGYLRVTLEWAAVLQPVQAPAPRAPTSPPAAAHTEGDATGGPAPLDESCLADGEAIVEAGIVSAAVQDGELSEGQSMHATFSFLSGPEHATKAVLGCTAAFGYFVSAKFSVCSGLLSRLRDEEVLFRLHRGSGHRHAPFGEARVMLSEALRAFGDGSAVNPRALSLELPIHGASDSSQPIGHCRVSFRCSASLQPAARAYLAGAARAPHRTSPAPHGARQPHSPREWSECSMTDLDRSAEAQGVAQRVSDDTTTWPADRTLNAIVCVHSLELLGPWASAPARTWESFVVFWSLLDSLVAAQLESTAERPCRGAHLALGDTTVYDLGGGSAEHKRARGWLRERLATDGDLAFGAVARARDGPDAVAYTSKTALRTLMATDERQWRGATLPMYLADAVSGGDGQRVHVADLVVTVAAQRALQRVWRAK